jgi:hypothetical protein
MVGATFLGAMAAADLSDYPSNFIEDGKFNGLLVVGKNAAAEDVVGITNIAMSLQAVSVKKVPIDTGAGMTAGVDDGYELGDDDFYFDEDLSTVETSELEASDLPDLLADGVYDDNEGENDNEEDYEQTISFNTAGQGLLGIYQDDDAAPEAGSYLFFDDASTDYIYTYNLLFDNPVDYDNTSKTDAGDDLESTSIDILGQRYTITDIDLDAGDQLDKITMMAGDTVLWLQQGDEITVTVDSVDHTVEMVDVDENADSCGFKVDGDSVWIDVDDTEEKNGVSIGVTDARAVHSEKQDADICEVNLGANELILEDGQEVEINGDEVDGSMVTINGANGEWDGFDIEWVTEDEIYLAPGESLIDPVFGSWKLVFAGLETSDSEELTATSSGNDGEIVFMNKDDKEVVIPLWFDDAQGADTLVYLGTSADAEDRLYVEDTECDFSGGDVEDCQGAMFYAVASEEVHIIEITDIDLNNDEMSFEDLTYGSTDNAKDFNFDTIGDVTVSLGQGLGDVTFNCQNAADADVACSNATATTLVFEEIDDGSTVETSLEGEFIPTWDVTDETAPGLTDFDFDERLDTVGQTTITVTPTAVDNGGSADFDDIEFDVSGQDYDVDFSDENDDDKVAGTYKGTWIEYDDEDKDYVMIMHYYDDVIAKVFVTPLASMVVSSSGAGVIESEQVQKISVGAVKLDSEVSNIKAQNAVVVGGPCANTAAASLMGNPANCAEGFVEGEGIIKLFENGDNIAMLVAGYSALDTRKATQVVAEYSEYDLEGAELVVTGTSLTDVSVSAPVEEAEMPAEGEAEAEAEAEGE